MLCPGGIKCGLCDTTQQLGKHTGTIVVGAPAFTSGTPRRSRHDEAIRVLRPTISEASRDWSPLRRHTRRLWGARGRRKISGNQCPTVRQAGHLGKHANQRRGSPILVQGRGAAGWERRPFAAACPRRAAVGACPDEAPAAVPDRRGGNEVLSRALRDGNGALEDPSLAPERHTHLDLEE